MPYRLSMRTATTAPFSKPKSFDFRGQHELDWDRIEMEIHAIAMRVMAVEIVGRGAVESVHSEA
jgi:hypothetical protein